MSERLTAWFPANVKPVRVGWYEREYPGEWMGKCHDYWDGEHWLVGNGSSATERAQSQKRWRGLADRAPAQGAGGQS